MVFERADIRIDPHNAVDFEAAVTRAVEIFRELDGFIDLKLQRCVEEPDLYQLLISWSTLEDHLEGFRGSPQFLRWRELVGRYFAQPPLVIHFATSVVSS